MQDIKTLVRKLRAAANVLEELFMPEGTIAIARKIIAGGGAPKRIGRPPGSGKKQPPHSPTKRGFSYKGKHWTQRPGNRAKLLAMAKKSAKTREAQNPSNEAREPGWAAVKHG
jgi:hypothetical protein